MLGLLCAYAAMARAFGKRAGLLGALVLATAPYYAMMTHQAITDMPCVGTMVAAMMMLLLAVQEDPERRVRSYRIGPWTVSAHEIVLGLFLMLALPQILYLISRNVTWDGSLFAWHRDEFEFGSGHNPDVPGNAGLHPERPRVFALWAEPLSQALLWATCSVAVVLQLRRERRAQSLYMIAFYVLCGLSFMAKGIPGFAEPGLIALLYLVACNRWSLLFAGRLRVALGALALTTVSLPWFVAMYMRHGHDFTDRLLIHDHLNRLTAGVHGDTGSIQYFVQQLGYGMFPWIALVPIALAPLALVLGVGGLRGNLRGMLPPKLKPGQQAIWVFQHGLGAWPSLLLIALGVVLFVLAWRLRRKAQDSDAAPVADDTRDQMLSSGLLAAGVVCAFVGRDLSWTTAQRPAGSERLIQLFIYNYDRPFPANLDYRVMFGGFAIVATVLLFVAAARALRPVATQAFVALGVMFTLFYLDVYMVDLTPHWSQRDLVQRYYRERKSAKEPLVAWQMNWKGENFYTGNRVAVFVDLNNKEFTSWIDKHKGTTTYVVLEHGRLPRLKTLMGARKVESLTDERDNNKFLLVRVVL
jgi:hypothetical protein